MKKIVVRMSAGLANRMFQYSYYLYLKKKGYNVSLDNLYKPTKWKMEDIEWNRIFPNAVIPQASKWEIYKMGGAYDLLSKFRRHYLSFTTNVIMPKTYEIVDEEKLEKNLYVAGAFQNANMVEQIISEAQNAFTFSPLVDDFNQSAITEIRNSNSISIHIRKGKDYLTRPDYKGACEADYYNKAIEYFKTHIDKPQFFLFTDNWEWVKDNIKGISYKAVNWNPSVGWGNHFDMQLMSMCKHNIIANSTYSWWGAYLNTNKDKIVISPERWFSKELHKYENFESHIIPNNWIKL